MPPEDMWVCCQCGRSNEITLASRRCSVCLHDICGKCHGSSKQPMNTSSSGWDGPEQSEEASTAPLSTPTNVVPSGFIEESGALLDPTGYFGALEELTIRVIASTRISGYEVHNGTVDMGEGLYDLERCIQEMTGVYEGFRMLQNRGFCGRNFTILMSDYERDNVALTIAITEYAMEKLLDIAKRIERFTNMERDLRAKQMSTDSLIVAEEHINVEFDSLDHSFELHRLMPRSFLAFSSRTEADSPTTRLIFRHKILYPYLALGLASYTGSHIGNFDEIAFGSNVSLFRSRSTGLTMRREKLACLDSFLGTGAWIFNGREGNEEGHLLSITVQQFADLWGPLRREVITAAGQSIECLHASRGLIMHETIPELLANSWTREVDWTSEVGCHYWPEMPDLSQRYAPIESNLFSQGSTQLVIGSPIRCELTRDSRCQNGLKVLQSQPSFRTLPLGTTKPRSVTESYQVSVSLASNVFRGGAITWKLQPPVSYKDRVLEMLQRPSIDWEIIIKPLLRLRLGLEVSACTGNACRITLWDTLRLYYCQGTPLECSHDVGDIFCLRECCKLRPPEWIESDQNDRSKMLENLFSYYRATITIAMLELKYTGVDKEGNLQVYWPLAHPSEGYTTNPKCWSQTDICWIPFLKDRMTSSTFAVLSNRCFTFSGFNEATDENILGPCRRIENQQNEREINSKLRAVLMTKVKLTIDAATKEYDAMFEKNGIVKLDKCIYIGDPGGLIGTLKIKSRGTWHLAEFQSESGWAQSVLGSYIQSFRSQNTHEELVNEELANPTTISVFVI